ncbi:MAG: glycosyltransferase [Candidatus Falkowbacteria bacterium]
MKIIYIVNVRIPTEKTHGYQICKMCEEFSNQSAEVELWIPARDVGQINNNAFFFYGLKNNFRIKKIKGTDFYKYFTQPGKFLFWLQGFLFVLQSIFIKVDKTAIIYTRDPEIGWLFNLRGFKTVYEAHTWPENRTWLYKFLIKKINKIVCITQGLENCFVKAGYFKNNILVAPDGVDLKKFDIDLDKGQARNKLNLPLAKKIILYIGHLYEWKGAQDLADAAILLKDNYLTIFVGGVDSDVAVFKEKNQALIQDGKIAVYYHQPRQLMPRWLKAADILVLPNKSREKISSHFTSPLKLFEYMAARRPIVASDLPSLREVLNEKNCLFFKSDDAKNLAKKITWLLENQEMADKITEQAYFDVKNYTWEKRAENIIKFI